MDRENFWQEDDREQYRAHLSKINRQAVEAVRRTALRSAEQIREQNRRGGKDE